MLDGAGGGCDTVRLAEFESAIKIAGEPKRKPNKRKIGNMRFQNGIQKVIEKRTGLGSIKITIVRLKGLLSSILQKCALRHAWLT